jgi:glycosyltransferase involved in cell wall biosynthesis
MHRLNILLTFPNTEKGGGIVTALQVAEILSKKNDVFFLIGGEDFYKLAKFYGCRVDKVKFIVYSKGSKKLTNLLEPLRLRRELKSLLKKTRIDVFIDLGGILLNGGLSSFYGIPSIVTFHEFTQGTSGGILGKFYNRLFLLTSKFIVKKISVISVNSKYTQNAFSKTFNVKPIIRPPLVASHFFSKTPRCSSTRIVCLCRIARHKELERLIRACKIMDNIELVIVGSVTDKNYLNDLEKMSAGENVRFVTNAPKEEVLKILEKAKIFWYGYGYEWFGIALAEAQAMGLPAVTFGGGGPSEIVIDGKTGFIVRTEEDMAKKTKILLKNEQLWKAMSKNAQKYAYRFGPEEFERKLYEAIDLAIRSGRK